MAAVGKPDSHPATPPLLRLLDEPIIKESPAKWMRDYIAARPELTLEEQAGLWAWLAIENATASSFWACGGA